MRLQDRMKMGSDKFATIVAIDTDHTVIKFDLKTTENGWNIGYKVFPSRILESMSFAYDLTHSAVIKDRTGLGLNEAKEFAESLALLAKDLGVVEMMRGGE